jgi:LPS export ABC transporter protein LptC
MKWFTIVLTSVLIGGISFASVWLFASSWNPLWTVQSASTALLPDIRAQHIQVIAQTDSTANWQVTAEDAAFYNEGQITVLHRVSLQYLQHASPLLRMTAAQGQIDNTTGDITVAGTVSMKYHETYTIETEKISWRALDHVLHTDLPVKIFNPWVQITGQQLNGEVRHFRIALKGNIQASFQIR